MFYTYSMKKLTISVLLFAVLCFTGCNKSESSKKLSDSVSEKEIESQISQASNNLNESQSENPDEIIQTQNETAVTSEDYFTIPDYNTEMGNFLSEQLTTKFTPLAEPFHTDSHKEYLEEPMEFSDLPTQNILDGQTAVVGSRICMAYPESAFTFDGTDYKNRKLAILNSDIEQTGTPVAFATIVKIKTIAINNAPDQKEYTKQMFNFQDNWNWFYEAEWDGGSGWIYGADLYGLKDSMFKNQISAELYKTGGKFDKFYPCSGYNPLSDEVQNSLKENKLAIQRTAPLKNVGTDDMIDLYYQLRRDKNIPIFITTDLAAHSQHLVFDRILQHIEEEYFFPRIQKLSTAFIQELSKRTDVNEDIRKKAVEYFQIPELILRTAPDKTETGIYSEPIEYIEKSSEEINQIISEYSEAVVTNYKSIMAANAVGIEAIFNQMEDFTQYKPRGHYTKNKILESYFRAQMWFGRINFIIAHPDSETASPEVLEMLPVAMLITDTVQKNPQLYTTWTELFDPITLLIGFSDDLSFRETMPVWKSLEISNFTAWASDKNNLLELMQICHEKLSMPKISGTSVFYTYSEKDENSKIPHNPMGWRFLGQRFTYDSFIHEKVSSPRLYGRMMVQGLDIIKALGSKYADTLLADDYKKYPDLNPILEIIQKNLSEKDEAFWKQNYYNQILYQIKTLASFEQDAGFYFTQSPLWNVKSQLSAHGTWAELRHDTILYAKQSYAEKGGDGDYEPTFRTEQIPEPTHYIEPNVPFWEASLAAAEGLNIICSKFSLDDNDTKSVLENLMNVYTKCLEISKKEAANEPITADENRWIPTLISTFGHSVMVHNRGDWITDRDLLKMACIADVFTNIEDGVCLEVGIANPHKLYVPLNDGHGGKRIAIGYVFSYCEFPQPANNRLNDDEWKEIVYKGDSSEVYNRMPVWEKECLLEK